jgi:acetyl-CoA carboxylase carboxyltransferase component
MGVDAAVKIIFRRELSNADDPEARQTDWWMITSAVANPYVAAERGYVDVA